MLKRYLLCLHPQKCLRQSKGGREKMEHSRGLVLTLLLLPTAGRGQVGRTAGGPAWSTRCVRTCPAPKGCPASGTSSARPTTGTATRRKASWQLSLWMVSFFISLCNSSLFFHCGFSSAGLPLLLRRPPLATAERLITINCSWCCPAVPLAFLIEHTELSMLYSSFWNAGRAVP